MPTASTCVCCADLPAICMMYVPVAGSILMVFNNFVMAGCSAQIHWTELLLRP